MDILTNGGLSFSADIDDSSLDEKLAKIDKQIADFYDKQTQAAIEAAKAQGELMDMQIAAALSGSNLNEESKKQLETLISLKYQYRDLTEAIKELNANHASGSLNTEPYSQSIIGLLEKEKELIQSIDKVSQEIVSNDNIMKSANNSISQSTTLLDALKKQFLGLTDAEKVLQGVKQNIDVVSQAEKDLLEQQLEAAKFYKEQGGQIKFTKPEVPETSIEDILGKGFAGTIKQAKEVYDSLDEESRDFISNLGKLKTALANNEAAQKALNKANESGKLSAKDYATGVTYLATQHKVLSENIDGLVTAQKHYDALNNNAISYFEQRKALLEDYQRQLAQMTQAERENPSEGGALEKQIAALRTEVEKLNPAKIKEVVSATKTALTELRDLKNKLATTDESDPGYGALIDRATELRQKIANVNAELRLTGSNVAGLDATINATSALVGAFGSLQGAIALVDSDSDDLQETLTKVAGAFGVLQGLHELSSAVAEESPLNAYLKRLLRIKGVVGETSEAMQTLDTANAATTASTETLTAATEVNVAASEAQTVATEEQAIASEGAAVAQRSLNAALLANPALVILTSVAALYGAYEILSRTLGKVSDAEKERLAVASATAEAQSNAGEAIGKEQGQLELLLATAKEEVLTKEQRLQVLHQIHQQNPEYLSGLNLENLYTAKSADLIEKQIDLIKKRATARAATSLYQDKLKEQIQAQAELNAYLNGQRSISSEIFAATKEYLGFSDAIAGSGALGEKLENLNAATLAANGAFDVGVKSQTDFAEATTNNAQQVTAFIDVINGFASKLNSAFSFKIPALTLPFNPQVFEDEKKRVEDLAQYRVDAAQKGSLDEFAARRKQTEDNYQQELKDRRLFDEKGNAIDAETDAQANAEALAIQGKYIADVHALNDEARQRELQSQTDLQTAIIDILKTSGKEGSDAYYDARRKGLEKAALQELYQARFNAAEQKRIYAQLAEDKRQIDKEQRTTHLETDRSTLNTQVSQSKPGTNDELNLKIELIKNQQELDKEAADVAVATTEQKVAKQREIEAKAAREISDLIKQYNLDEQKAYADTQIANIETRLATVKLGSADELQLRRDLIDQQTQLQNLSDASQIKNANELAAKLRENDAKAFVDKRKLQDDYNKALLDRQLSFIEHSKDAQIAADEEIIGSMRSTFAQIYKAQVDEINAQIDAIQQQEFKVLSANITGDIKDSDAQKIIADLQKQIGALQAKLNNVKDAHSIQELQRVGKITGSIGQSLAGLSDTLKPFNSGLADTVSILSSAADKASQFVNNLAGVASKDPTAIISLFTEQLKTNLTALNDFQQGHTLQGILRSEGPIGGLFASAIDEGRESAEKANKELQSYQDSLITGEIAYHQLLRQREDTIKNINQLTVDQLNIQKQQLDLSKQQAQQDYQTLLTQIQLTGKQVTGAHTEKYGGILGVGKKSRTVQDTAGLNDADYDTLEALFTKGALDDATAKWFQQLKAVHDELDGITDTTEQVKEQITETLTGTTSDNIADSIKTGLANGYESFADFSDNINELLRNAILSAFAANVIKPKAQELFDALAQFNSDGQITQSEVDQFRNIGQQVTEDIASQYDKLKQLSGLDFSSSLSDKSNSLQGAIKGISESTAELLAGQFGGLRLTAAQQLAVMYKQLDQLNRIGNNTDYLPMMTQILDNQKLILADMQNRGIKIRS